LKPAFIAVLLISAAASAGTADLFTEVGTGFALGGWGEGFGPGFNLGLGGEWRFTPGFRAGGAVDMSAFSRSDGGGASLFMSRPMVRAAFYFNPGSASFNPGVTASFGMCRTALESGGGADSPSWDPFWRAGIRWDMSLGAPWRAALGLDLESVMAEGKSGDAVRLVLAVSREVRL